MGSDWKLRVNGCGVCLWVHRDKFMVVWSCLEAWGLFTVAFITDL